MKIPDRWLNYKDSGRIYGTRFVACKVPLKQDFNKNLPPSKSFTPQKLRHKYPNIKLIVDLTFTTKYYDAEKEFEANGVKYIKITCVGHVIPREEGFQKFVEVVENFINNNPEDYLIGVHCTHGVNRTGFFIVRYMIERLGYSSKRALRDFLKYRHHAIERTNYIKELHRISSQREKESEVDGENSPEWRVVSR